jgi:hypothetical protein
LIALHKLHILLKTHAPVAHVHIPSQDPVQDLLRHGERLSGTISTHTATKEEASALNQTVTIANVLFHLASGEDLL